MLRIRHLLLPAAILAACTADIHVNIDADDDDETDTDGPTCEPTAPHEHPMVCFDGLDNDCDGSVDCADSDCASTPECGGCQPEDHPAACFDGLDNDCDGLWDCEDPSCFQWCGMCEPNEHPMVCGDGIDNDCDGMPDCVDPDCFGLPQCGGCQPEVCEDGIDNDCDGLIDCADGECQGSPNCPSCFPQPLPSGFFPPLHFCMNEPGFYSGMCGTSTFGNFFAGTYFPPFNGGFKITAHSDEGGIMLDVRGGPQTCSGPAPTHGCGNGQPFPPSNVTVTSGLDAGSPVTIIVAPSPDTMQHPMCFFLSIQPA